MELYAYFIRRRFLQTAAVTTLITTLQKNRAQAETNAVPMRTLGRSGEKVSMVGLGGYHVGMQQDENVNVLSAIKEIHGKNAKRVHEDVIGRLPTQDEQDLLKIVRSTPVLEVHRTYFAEDNTTVVMYCRIIFVASYFVLSYDYAAPSAEE